MLVCPPHNLSDDEFSDPATAIPSNFTYDETQMFSGKVLYYFLCRRQKRPGFQKLSFTYSLIISWHKGDGKLQGVGVGVDSTRVVGTVVLLVGGRVGST